MIVDRNPFNSESDIEFSLPNDEVCLIMTTVIMIQLYIMTTVIMIQLYTM